MILVRVAIVAALAALCGCASGGDDDPGRMRMDAGPPDGIDAGLPPPGTDAGPPPPGTDAGPPPAVDAGRDAGPPLVLDAGTGPCRDGALMACPTTCGTTGLRTCTGGVFGACDAPAETCDNVDQNCNGSIDEGLMRGCVSACGAGTETCAAGAWMGCTAPMPRAEECNRVDDDCDGRVDEGQQAVVFAAVPMAELTAAQPACSGPRAGLDVCMTAAKRWCIARGSCFVGGAGFLQATAAIANIVCFGPDTVEIHATFDEVSVGAAFAVTPSNIGTRVALSGVNRFCQSRGYAAGTGPVEHSYPDIYVDCLPTGVGVYTATMTSALQALGCDPLTDPDRLECAAASDTLCRGLGHIAGIGPVEWNTTDSGIVCFANPP